MTITVDPPPSVSGTVVDPSLQPLDGVVVRAYATTDTWLPTATTTSQAGGTYTFASLPAGTYAIQFAAPGFPLQWTEGKSREDASSVTVVDRSSALSTRFPAPIRSCSPRSGSAPR